MTDEKVAEILEKAGWVINCESPYEIIHEETGSCASGIGANLATDALITEYKETQKEECKTPHTEPKKYDYLTRDSFSSTRQLGLLGWELCGINPNGVCGIEYYYKRPHIPVGGLVSEESKTNINKNLIEMDGAKVDGVEYCELTNHERVLLYDAIFLNTLYAMRKYISGNSEYPKAFYENSKCEWVEMKQHHYFEENTYYKMTLSKSFIEDEELETKTDRTLKTRFNKLKDFLFNKK